VTEEEIKRLDQKYAGLIKKECFSEDNWASGDAEDDHVRADGLLVELLKVLGCKNTVEEFEAVGKWYA